MEKGRYDAQIVTFARLKNALERTAIETWEPSGAVLKSCNNPSDQLGHFTLRN